MQPYLEEAVRASHLPYLLMMSSVTGRLPDGNGAQGGRDSLLLSQRSAWQHSCTQQMFIHSDTSADLGLSVIYHRACMYLGQGPPPFKWGTVEPEIR